MVSTQNENIHALSEQAVVRLLDSLFDKVVYLDPETVRYNIGLASENGMSKSDRAIRLERANYLLSHFAHIYVGLLASPEFRDAFETAVKVEIAMDSLSAKEQQEFRSQMTVPSKKPSKGYYVLNLANYNDKYYKLISAKLLDSFDKFKDYDETIDALVNTMLVRDRLLVGFCVSNFAYLFRAFAKNDTFVSYVKTVISNVETKIHV